MFGSGNARLSALRRFLAVVLCVAMVSSGVPSSAVAFALDEVQGDVEVPAEISDAGLSLQEDVDGEAAAEPVPEPESPVVGEGTDQEHTENAPEASVSETVVTDVVQSTSEHEAETPAEETPVEYEHVHIVFDANVADGDEHPATGTMEDFDFILDGQPHGLPEMGFVREGFEFAGWSTTRDGRDVADDPATKADESMVAFGLAEGTPLVDLGYIEVIRDVDADGNVTGVREILRNLADVKRDGVITLYVQWVPVKAEEADAEAPTGEDAQDVETKSEEDGDKTSSDSQEEVVVEIPDETGTDTAGDAKQTEDEGTEVVSDVPEQIGTRADLMSVLRSGDVALTGETVDDGADAPSVGPMLLGGPLRAPAATRTFAITFDAGEGTFEGGSSTNVINVSETTSDVTKVSHTPNVDDEGTKVSNYANNLSLNDVVTVPGASEITVTIKAGGEGTSYDWACVWDGAHPEYSAYSDWPTSRSGRLGGRNLVTRTYTVAGDSVTFGFRSNASGTGSGTGGGYGYFATVSGTSILSDYNGSYQVPTGRDGLRFAGWEDADDNLVSDWKSLTEGTTLTARYADYKVSFDSNGGTGSMAEMSLGPGIVAPVCLFVAPEGMIFAHWNTAADGSGVSYDVGDEIDYTVGNITLYPQWEMPAAFAVLDADGNMTFFRAARSSQTGSDVSVVDIDGIVRTGDVWFVDEDSTDTSTSVPWSTKRGLIKRVSFAHAIHPKSMSYWFNNCSNLSDFDSTNLDTSGVIDMSYLFRNCINDAFNPDVSGWDVSNVRDMEAMFKHCSGDAFAPVIGSWHTPALTNMMETFAETNVTELDFSSFDFNHLRYYLRALPNSLARVTLGEDYARVQLPDEVIAGSSYGEFWQNVTTGGNPVTTKQLLENYQPTATSGDYAPGVYERQSRGHTYGVLTPDGDLVFVNGVTDPDTIVHCGANQTIVDTLGHSWTGTVFKDAERSTHPWVNQAYGRSVKRCYVAPGSTYVPESLNGFFIFMSNLESIDFSGFDTQDVHDMGSMCQGCTSLKSVDFSCLDTSSVVTMASAFQECTNLESVNMSGIDTRSVQNMTTIFMRDSKLKHIEGLESLDTRSLTSLSAAFFECTSLGSIDLSRWNVGNLTSLNSMLYSSDIAVDISNWNAPNLTASELGIGLRNASSIVGRNMKIGASVSNDTGFSLSGDNSIKSADFSGSTFYKAKHFLMQADHDVVLLDLGGVSMPMVELMQLFSNEKLTSVDLTNLNLPSLKNLNMAFAQCHSLTSVDLSSVYAPDVTVLADMFDGCTSLASVDLSGLGTHNATSWSTMFMYCRSLTSLDLSYLDTSSATNMAHMFDGCSNLVTLDLSSWDTGSVTGSNMDHMFSDCDALQRLSLGEEFVFVGDEDWLPDPVWKRLETGDTVSDLWHDYDGATMAGTYIRSMTTIESDDVYDEDNISDLTYDSETGEVVIYLKSQSHIVPTAMNLPALMGLLKVHKAVIGDSEQLMDTLDKAVEGTAPLPNLSLSVVTLAYGDMTTCAADDNVLFTFDVPKNSTEHVKLELWRAARGSDDYVYAGYLENSFDEPKVFRHYDANGALIDTIAANERYSKADVYGVSVEDYPTYVEPLFPAYEDFITYNPSMDNFEVKTGPGHYRIVLSLPDTPSFEISGVTKSEDDTYYQFSFDGESDPAYLTLFNSVDSVDYTDVVPGRAVLGRFRKVDAETGRGVYGALYMFVGAKNGDVMYGRTDSDGYIYAYSNASVSTVVSSSDVRYVTWLNDTRMLYSEMDADGNLSRDTHPVMDETYRVYELTSPRNYYKNPSLTTVKFVGSVSDPEVVETEGVIRHDGVTITVKEAYKDCNTCHSCSLGMGQCLCGLYRRHSCTHCGGSSAEVHVTIANSQHKDQPYPQASVSKVDSLRKPLAGAHLQILDGSEVIDDWVSDGSLHAFRFAETGEHGIAYGERGRQFVLHEVATPGSAYKLAADIPFTVDWDSGVVQLRMVDDDIVDVSVDKEWYPSAPVGASCTFTLVVDGTLSDKTITLDGTADETGESAPWVATFEDLPRYDARTFKAISYKVVETRTSLGWAPEVPEAVESGGTIRNMRTVGLPATGLGGTPAEFAGCGLAIVATSLSALWLRRRRRGMAA